MIVENAEANPYATTEAFSFIEFALPGSSAPSRDLLGGWPDEAPILVLDSETSDVLCSVRVPRCLVGAVQRASVLYQADLIGYIKAEIEDRGDEGLWLNGVYTEEV